MGWKRCAIDGITSPFLSMQTEAEALAAKWFDLSQFTVMVSG